MIIKICDKNFVDLKFVKINISDCFFFISHLFWVELEPKLSECTVQCTMCICARGETFRVYTRGLLAYQ